MLWQMSALDAAAKITGGEITSVDLVGALIERINETDSAIGAWASFDAKLALEQAGKMDELRASGFPTGPLHGVPVGVKDIYDTAAMATAWGTECHAARQAEADAAVVDRLHEAGAIILGKTVTTALAFASAGPTRNPYNDAHTAGGSSAGSAAGVAAGHVPLAIGSQTNGSTIRPASFCGVYGFKPSRGMISRRGCLQTSQTLDQVGVMARSLEEVALLADVLVGFDPADRSTYARPKPKMLEGCRASVPIEPNFAWFDQSYHDQLSDVMRQGLEEVLSELGDRVDRLPAPKSFAQVIKHHQTVHEYEFHLNLENDPSTSQEHIHETLAPVLERARQISKAEYNEALAYVAGAEEYFATFFNDYDAVIAPSALGEAPLLAEGAGNPICSTIWTFAGLPCLSLPLLRGETGLPAGVQLIGSREQDDRLLRTATWLETHLALTAGDSTDTRILEGSTP